MRDRYLNHVLLQSHFNPARPNPGLAASHGWLNPPFCCRAIMFPGHMTNGVLMVKSFLMMTAIFLTRQARMTKSMRMIGTKARPSERRPGNGFSENAYWQKLHKGTQRDTKGHKGTEEDTKGQHFFAFFCSNGRGMAGWDENGCSENSVKKPMNLKKSRLLKGNKGRKMGQRRQGN